MCSGAATWDPDPDPDPDLEPVLAGVLGLVVDARRRKESDRVGRALNGRARARLPSSPVRNADMISRQAV